MDRRLILLNVLFATALVISNVMDAKIILLWDTVVLPSAVFAYICTFLFADVISELYGKERARQTVMIGFIAQIFASVMFLIGQYLPVAPFNKEAQPAYEMILGQNWRFVTASLAAYYISQNLDVLLFHYLKKRTGGKHKWFRKNVSTAISQFVDTTIYITVAFYGSVPNILTMIISQYVVKYSLVLIDTPLFYLFTRTSDRNGKAIKADARSAKTTM